MRSWLAALTAVAVLVPACAALATEPDAPHVPMSADELAALEVHLNLAAMRVTRHLEALIESRVERLMIARLATGAPPPPAPARIGPARRASARRAPEGCAFEANVLSCRVLGSRPLR